MASGERLRALTVSDVQTNVIARARAARLDGSGGEDVLLVLTPSGRVKALTEAEARAAHARGDLVGWQPLDPEEPR